MFETQDEGLPIGRRGNFLEDLTPGIRTSRRIEDQFRPPASICLVRKDIDHSLGYSLSAVLVMDINMIALPSAFAGYRLGKIVEHDEADKFAVNGGSQKFPGPILKQLLRIILIWSSWRATFQCLAVSCDQWRQFQGIPEMNGTDINLWFGGHLSTFIMIFCMGVSPATDNVNWSLDISALFIV